MTIANQLQINFVKRAERLGFQIDTSSASALMKSLDTITDPTACKLLQLLCYKATQRAKYFCAGMLDIAKYQHYALNQPLYTHFTSPIRRYADILVHRQLDAVLQGGGVNVFIYCVTGSNFSLQSIPSSLWIETPLPRSLSSAICKFVNDQYSISCLIMTCTVKTTLLFSPRDNQPIFSCVFSYPI